MFNFGGLLPVDSFKLNHRALHILAMATSQNPDDGSHVPDYSHLYPLPRGRRVYRGDMIASRTGNMGLTGTGMGTIASQIRVREALSSSAARMANQGQPAPEPTTNLERLTTEHYLRENTLSP